MEARRTLGRGRPARLAGVLAILVGLVAMGLPTAGAAPSAHAAPAPAFVPHFGTFHYGAHLVATDVHRCWSGSVHFVNTCTVQLNMTVGSTIVAFVYEGLSDFSGAGCAGVSCGQTFAFTATADGPAMTQVAETEAPGSGVCSPSCPSTGFGLAVTAFVYSDALATGEYPVTASWTSTAGLDTVVWVQAVDMTGLPWSRPVSAVASNVSASGSAVATAHVPVTTTGWNDVLMMGVLGWGPSPSSASNDILAMPQENSGVLGGGATGYTGAESQGPGHGTGNTTARCVYCITGVVIGQPNASAPATYQLGAKFTTGVHYTAGSDRYRALAIALNVTQPPIVTDAKLSNGNTKLWVNWTETQTGANANDTLYFIAYNLSALPTLCTLGSAFIYGFNTTSVGNATGVEVTVPVEPTGFNYCIAVSAWAPTNDSGGPTPTTQSYTPVTFNLTVPSPAPGAHFIFLQNAWIFDLVYLGLFAALVTAILIGIFAQKRKRRRGPW